MNNAYIFQSSLILYFFRAAGKTFQHGSSRVTRKDFAAFRAASLARDRSRSLASPPLDPWAESLALTVELVEEFGPRDASDPFEVGPEGGVGPDAPRIDVPEICRPNGGGCSD